MNLKEFEQAPCDFRRAVQIVSRPPDFFRTCRSLICTPLTKRRSLGMLILLACIDHDAVFLTRLSIVKALGDAYYAWRPKRRAAGSRHPSATR